MAKKLSFNDRLIEFLGTASEAELHSAAAQIALAIRLKFGVAKPAKKAAKKKPEAAVEA